MEITRYGETEWSDDGQSDKVEFMKLKEGSNNVRVITKPFRFFTHKVKFSNDPNTKGGGGRPVRCGEENSCVLCKKVNGKGVDLPDNLEVETSKPRWYVGIIDRDAKNAVKILEIGKLVRGKLKGLAESKKWGDPRFYDVDITKDSNAKAATDYYNVVPDPTDKGPLSPEDEKIAATCNVDDLKNRCNPFTEQQIRDAIDKYADWIEAALTAADKGKKSAKKVETRKPATEDDDEVSADNDFSFEQQS